MASLSAASLVWHHVVDEPRCPRGLGPAHAPEWRPGAGGFRQQVEARVQEQCLPGETEWEYADEVFCQIRDSERHDRLRRRTAPHKLFRGLREISQKRA